MCDVRLTGLYCPGRYFEPPLYIGVMFVSFNISGLVLSSRLFLSIIFNGNAISFLISFRSIAGTPSGPAAEFSSRSPIASIISSVLTSMSFRSSSVVSLKRSLSFSSLLLNCDLYSSSNFSTMSTGSCISVPSIFKGPIVFFLPFFCSLL